MSQAKIYLFIGIIMFFLEIGCLCYAILNTAATPADLLSGIYCVYPLITILMFVLAIAKGNSIQKDKIYFRIGLIMSTLSILIIGLHWYYVCQRVWGWAWYSICWNECSCGYI